MGCTEPIAIAYAASVAVPNAGDQKGIAVAGIPGLVGGNPEKQLEVISVCVTRTRRSCT